MESSPINQVPGIWLSRVYSQEEKQIHTVRSAGVGPHHHGTIMTSEFYQYFYINDRKIWNLNLFTDNVYRYFVSHIVIPDDDPSGQKHVAFK